MLAATMLKLTRSRNPLHAALCYLAEGKEDIKLIRNNYRMDFQEQNGGKR